MNIEELKPAREFPVGYEDIILRHSANIELEDDEMVTFVSGESQYDVCKKSWGYYATPSLDKRLPHFGLRPALMRNRRTRHCFLVLVHHDHIPEWREYMAGEDQELVAWLDDPAILEDFALSERPASE